MSDGTPAPAAVRSGGESWRPLVTPGVFLVTLPKPVEFLNA